MRKIFYAFLLVCNLTTINVLGQQGNLDHTFNTIDDGITGDGFDNIVRTISLQEDGNLIVGGDFLNFNGASLPYLCRLKTDGEKDTNFNIGSGFNNKVYATHVQSDGKIIVGGSFTAFSGNTTSRLLRLNPDGSFDATFITALGLNNIVYDIDSYADGKAIVVGSFTKYGETTASRIAKILPNGSLDASFSTGVGANSLIEKVIIQPDGKILLGGTFTKFNTQNKNSIVRLNSDGSIDNSFNIGTGFDDKVTSIDLQLDGKIIVIGAFSHYNGIVANRIIRLNTDGSIDSAFQPGTGFDAENLYVVNVDSLGNIMVGGAFTGTYNGVSVNRLVYLNSDGTLKNDFDIGAGPASASVLALAKSKDDFWYVGGSFSVFDGQNQGRLAKIDSNGILDIGFLTPGVGFNHSVLKILPLENNASMIFGSFSKFNGKPSSRIARLLEDGSLDQSFNAGKSGANNIIRTAVLQNDGKMIIGGNFTNYNGNVANRLARILPNGEFDTAFNIGVGVNSFVYALAIQSDKKIIVAGNFTKFNTIAVGRIIRLMPDGTIDASFNTGLGADAIIDVVIVQSDNKILVGGRFTTFNGVSSPHLVRLNANGTIDTSFSIGTGFDKNVYTIGLQSDNKIILGGSFLNYNGVSQNRITRLLPNGNLDISFTSGTGFSKGDVRTILVQPNDRILVGGTFSGTYKGVAALRIIRLLSNGAIDESFQTSLNSTLFTMALSTNHNLIIGGNFNSVSGIAKHRVARLFLCTDNSTWNGTWSRGFPSAGKELLFQENYNALITTKACSCQIEAGKTVTIPKENALSLIYNYNGLGRLILENGASLYQFDEKAINTGIIQLKRTTTPVRRYDFTYWSSPVFEPTLESVSPETLSDKYHSYDGTKWVYEDKTNKMKNGKGYVIRAPQPFSTTDAKEYTAIFEGVPNNGTIEGESVTAGNYYMAGNPYPSAISADVFLEENKKILEGTIEFWSHNTSPIYNDATGKYEYQSSDYLAYNGTGSIGDAAGNYPKGSIASGQSVSVKVRDGIASGTKIMFKNKMRVEPAASNSQFFKPSKTAESNTDKSRLWLNFTNSKGVFKQTLLGYVEGATNGYEDKYDAISSNANPYADFYSINENQNFVIQGRALPFDVSEVIPLGFSAAVDGDFTIDIAKLDGIFDTIEIYLEDKFLNKIHNLKESSYTFTTQKGSFNDRFVLRFADGTLATTTFEKSEKELIVYQSHKQLVVVSQKENILKIQAYNMAGKLIFEEKTNQNKVILSNLKPNNQVLILKIETENNTQYQKVLF